MNNNVIFMAISKGGVIVAKEVGKDLTQEQFVAHFEEFRRLNYTSFCTFMTERELRELLKRFE